MCVSSYFCESASRTAYKAEYWYSGWWVMVSNASQGSRLKSSTEPKSKSSRTLPAGSRDDRMRLFALPLSPDNGRHKPCLILVRLVVAHALQCHVAHI